MRPKSDFIALEFSSERDESAFLDALISRQPQAKYTLVTPHAVIMEKDYRAVAEDICKRLSVKPIESPVVEAHQLSQDELAKQRASRFLQRPDSETRGRLVREMQNKKQA